MARAPARVVLLPPWSLLQQLLIEESLMRSTHHSWLILSRPRLPGGTTVVMGAGAKPWKVLNQAVVAEREAPVLRRFSGGGTVAVDDGVTLTSIVSSAADVPAAGRFPPGVMAWSEGVYSPAFRGIGDGMALRAHDFCVGDRKVGGNAQAMARLRWVHHTSWLWDHASESMDLLSVPPTMPDYRASRRHDDFVVRIRDLAPEELSRTGFETDMLASMLRHFRPVGRDGEPLATPDGAEAEAEALVGAAAGHGPARLVAEVQAAWSDAVGEHEAASSRKSTRQLDPGQIAADR